jgi:Ca2+-binding EF-hand superfamily protein
MSLEHVYCEEAFKLIDKDGNGVLTRPEVRALALVCDNIAGSHTRPGSAQTQVITALMNDYNVAAVLQLPPQIRQEDGKRERFEKLFEMMDKDGSRGVDLNEFRSFWVTHVLPQLKETARQAAEEEAAQRAAEETARQKVEEEAAREAAARAAVEAAEEAAAKEAAAKEAAAAQAASLSALPPSGGSSPNVAAAILVHGDLAAARSLRPKAPQPAPPPPPPASVCEEYNPFTGERMATAPRPPFNPIMDRSPEALAEECVATVIGGVATSMSGVAGASAGAAAAGVATSMAHAAAAGVDLRGLDTWTAIAIAAATSAAIATATCAAGGPLAGRAAAAVAGSAAAATTAAAMGARGDATPGAALAAAAAATSASEALQLADPMMRAPVPPTTSVRALRAVEHATGRISALAERAKAFRHAAERLHAERRSEPAAERLHAELHAGRRSEHAAERLHAERNAATDVDTRIRAHAGLSGRQFGGSAALGPPMTPPRSKAGKSTAASRRQAYSDASSHASSARMALEHPVRVERQVYGRAPFKL